MNLFQVRSRYHLSIAFLFFAILLSCLNDVINRFVGSRIPTIEIIFFRFLIGAFSLVPFLVLKKDGRKSFKTNCLGINIARGVLGALSFYLCTYSVIKLPLVVVTSLLWSIPLFTIILSSYFLKERVGIKNTVATIFGFIGVLSIILCDGINNFGIQLIYIIPLIAAIFFAIQDILIKKMISYKENEILMLMYYALTASVMTLPVVFYVWVAPTTKEILLLIILGMFGNIMQFFLFKAYALSNISDLSPFRYIEFVIQFIFGFCFFSEIPSTGVVLGACTIVISTYCLLKKNNTSYQF